MSNAYKQNGGFRSLFFFLQSKGITVSLQLKNVPRGTKWPKTALYILLFNDAHIDSPMTVYQM